jgi:Transglycosylase SLT domain
MKILQIVGVIGTSIITAAFPLGKSPSAKPNAAIETEINPEWLRSLVPSTASCEFSQHDVSSMPEYKAGTNAAETQQLKAEDAFPVREKDQRKLQDDSSLEEKQQGKLDEDEDYFSIRDYSSNTMPIPYVALHPAKRPAEIVLDSLRGVPIGTPLEEIKRASDVFGLDFSFMRTIAKIESDFDPNQRTGSYVGLFQLDKQEFATYGSGDITNPRDNAVAAANKFATEATLFELDTHKKPTFSDLYLIHQQGWRGAAEHVSQPDRIAWKSMCATDEGRQKGEKWCKRAIWQNAPPTIKHIWKSVDKLTSGAFVDMWRERVDRLYARYSEAIPGAFDD